MTRVRATGSFPPVDPRDLSECRLRVSSQRIQPRIVGRAPSMSAPALPSTRKHNALPLLAAQSTPPEYNSMPKV